MHQYHRRTDDAAINISENFIQKVHIDVKQHKRQNGRPDGLHRPKAKLLSNTFWILPSRKEMVPPQDGALHSHPRKAAQKDTWSMG